MTTVPGTERHPHARAVLEAALAPGGAPSHAYLFHGPAGSGKRAVARSFAAALLSDGAADPANAAQRVEHDVHPDLHWVRPSGWADMRVEDIKPVVSAAGHTPFESRRRVFVIERVEAMNDNAANRLLKTLEEPPSFAHLILLTDRLGRRDGDDRQPLPARAFRAGAGRGDRGGVARGGHRRGGRATRAHGSASVTASARGAWRSATGRRCAPAPRPTRARSWPASRRGRGRGRRSSSRPRRTGRGRPGRRGARRGRARVPAHQGTQARRARGDRRGQARRAPRPDGTARRVVALAGLWLRDVACVLDGAPEVVHHSDRADEVAEDAEGHDVDRVRAAVALCDETRAAWILNPTEELALEALAYRCERVLGAG